MGKFVLVVIIIAALVYAGMWLLEQRRVAGHNRPRKPAPRVSAPDDDDEFLRRLRRPRSDDGGSDHGT
ncbi:MAG TPA: hypothetical protein VFJ19_13955 [Nocardioidaceae bacterium]|nr:hypothetical protein [Nocardioidaceae bacterium]